MKDLQRIVSETAKTLGLPDAAESAALAALQKRYRLAESFYSDGLERGFFKIKYPSLEKRYGGAFALAATLLLARRTKNNYERFGMPETVFWDTMSDIKLWEHNYFVKNGSHGIGELGWLKNHFKLEIFRLGRLQFQKTKLFDPLFKSVKGVRLGESALFVHIPQGEPLDIEKAKSSFLEANRFFEQYFPDFRYRLYVTETWLLYEKNRLFMKEGCNILKFSELFQHLGDKNLQKEATKRIFGKEYHADNRESSLEKAAKAYLESGGKLGIGVGYIEKSKLENNFASAAD